MGDEVSADRPIDPRPVLVVTGLVQEARIAAGPGMMVICSSSDPQQLRALLTTFDPTSIRGVISFGVAGGLVIIGGLIGGVGIRNPRRVVHAEQCSGGQLAGAPGGGVGDERERAAQAAERVA